MIFLYRKGGLAALAFNDQWTEVSQLAWMIKKDFFMMLSCKKNIYSQFHYYCWIRWVNFVKKNRIWIIFDQIHQIQGSNTNTNTGLLKKSNTNTNTEDSNTNTQIQIRIWPHPCLIEPTITRNLLFAVIDICHLLCKGSICSVVKWADTAFRLCTATAGQLCTWYCVITWSLKANQQITCLLVYRAAYWQV